MKVNNLFFKKNLIILGLLGIFLTFPITILAATGYGNGTYGDGNFNVGNIPTATPTSTVQNNTNSSSNSPSTSGCTNSPPVLVSDLFQINTNSTKAKIYFTPIDVTQFYISFSTKSNAEEYGELVTLAREGVQSHTIYLLKPNTTYYIKVRGQNGCAPGKWSNIMTFTTPSSSTKQTIFYKNTKLTNIIHGIKSVINKIMPTKKTTKTKTVIPVPNSIPTVVTKTTTSITTEKQTIKKKFCIFKLCF